MRGPAFGRNRRRKPQGQREMNPRLSWRWSLAASEKVTEFTCDYVRQLEWAKTQGTFPTYLGRPTQE